MSLFPLHAVRRTGQGRPRRINMRVVAIVVGWVMSVIAAVAGGAWSAGAFQTGLTMRVDANTVARLDHENRLRVIESQMSSLATDVRWIRMNFERRFGTGGASVHSN